jgi:hypothetical protein
MAERPAIRKGRESMNRPKQDATWIEWAAVAMLIAICAAAAHFLAGGQGDERRMEATR